MAAVNYPLVVEQGSDYLLRIPVLDGNDVPQTVTGWTATGQIRARHDSATVLYQLALTPVGQQVELRVPRAASATWTFRGGFYDVEIVAPDASVGVRLAEGVVVVRPEVTRS